MQESEEVEQSITEKVLQDDGSMPEMSTAYAELMQINIANESVLIPVSDVSEVIRLQPLSLVPMAPDHLLGVCNVHGHILCVIDPCRVMHLEGKAAEDSAASRFVSLRHSVMNLALRVDSVSELFRVQESELSELNDDSSEFFRGSINIDGHAYRVIDAAALFA